MGGGGCAHLSCEGRAGCGGLCTPHVALVDFVEAQGMFLSILLSSMASYYSIVGDESTDIATVEELSVFCHWEENDDPSAVQHCKGGLMELAPPRKKKFKLKLRRWHPMLCLCTATSISHSCLVYNLRIQLQEVKPFYVSLIASYFHYYPKRAVSH